MELDLFAREEAIDLLQREVARFRIEEVNEREEAKIENCSRVRLLEVKLGERGARHTGKVNISTVADAGDADRCDLNDEEGENPCKHVSLSQRRWLSRNPYSWSRWLRLPHASE